MGTGRVPPLPQASRTRSAAHALGLVHRDVRPANVLVAEGDIAKLTDFGLVRADGERAPDGLAAQLTADGAFVGSLRYVASEQTQRGLWSAASDCYARGATLFEVLSGLPPPPERGSISTPHSPRSSTGCSSPTRTARSRRRSAG